MESGVHGQPPAGRRRQDVLLGTRAPARTPRSPRPAMTSLSLLKLCFPNALGQTYSYFFFAYDSLVFPREDFGSTL